jgi:ABC-type transport system involved in multi-copper enzyme maturation permease subunit
MLVTDIGNEAEKGTLNFLRLSPRSSANILIGKLLGVPILSYLTILLLLPLHLLSAVLSITPLSFLLSTYFALGLWSGLLLAVVALLGFFGGSQSQLMGVTGT